MSRLKKITVKQAKAFDSVVKAIERAHKTGLVFFGKQFELVAFTQETAKYELDHDLISRRGDGDNWIEHLSASVLYDSGADDYGKYLSNSDDPYNGEFQETPCTYQYDNNKPPKKP